MSVSDICVIGMGAVSPAGWNVPSLCRCVSDQQEIPATECERPGWDRPLSSLYVPKATPENTVRHPRLRRAAPAGKFAVSAAREALSSSALPDDLSRLGIVYCTSIGSISYSRRFLQEVLDEPSVASPLVFPETVANAPASHLSAVQGFPSRNYALVGDSSVVGQGIAMAARWLFANLVDTCLVVAADEMDWLTADVLHRFSKVSVVSEGAGALLLGRASDSNNNKQLARLEKITDAFDYDIQGGRKKAVKRMAAQLADKSKATLLCEGGVGISKLDSGETEAWSRWGDNRIRPKQFLGEAFAASAMWQCISAIEKLSSSQSALVSLPGNYQYALGIEFSRS